MPTSAPAFNGNNSNMVRIDPKTGHVVLPPEWESNEDAVQTEATRFITSACEEAEEQGFLSAGEIGDETQDVRRNSGDTFLEKDTLVFLDDVRADWDEYQGGTTE